MVQRAPTRGATAGRQEGCLQCGAGRYPQSQAIRVREEAPSMFSFPPYWGELGLPHYWPNEKTGVLRAAVGAYLEREEVHPLFLAYLEYVIHAPCWAKNPAADASYHASLARLRHQIRLAHTPAEVAAWLERALDLGIDPL